MPTKKSTFHYTRSAGSIYQLWFEPKCYSCLRYLLDLSIQWYIFFLCDFVFMRLRPSYIIGKSNYIDKLLVECSRRKICLTKTTPSTCAIRTCANNTSHMRITDKHLQAFANRSNMLWSGAHIQFGQLIRCLHGFLTMRKASMSGRCYGFPLSLQDVLTT